VLAALLVDAGRPVTVETVIDRVWGDTPPDRVRHTLYVYVARLRKALGSSRLLNRSGGYVLAVDPGQVDLHVFRSQVARARAASCPEAERATLLRRALDLWRGTPLADVPGEWAAQVREGWRQQHLEAAVSWAQAALSAGAPGALVGPLVELSTEHPLAEPLVAALMRALHASGRRAEALDCFARIRKRLADELGVDPGAELQALHQAILRSDAAPASVSAPAPAPSPAQLPLDVHGFTGRAEALAQLDRTLQGSAEQPTAVVISAIAGTAGVGKTALAVHWAHRITDRFPDGQLYVNLRGFDPGGTVMHPGEAIRGFLDALQVPAQRIPSDLAAQVSLYRSLLAGKRMLVVLDNARDADQVRPLLPGAPGCLVLVTSRNQLTSLVAAEGAQPLTLDLLTEAEARQLLTRRLGAHRTTAEPHAVQSMVAACARLPLALAIVAAHAATRPAQPLAELAEQLRKSRTCLDAFDAGDTLTNLRAVFSWSYQALTPDAARLFRLLGLHPGPDIAAPAAASLGGFPVDHTRRLLAELIRAHLVTEPSPDRYAFHDLLRTYAAELANTLDTDDERRYAQHRMLDHYLHTADTAALLLDPSRDPVVTTPPATGTLLEPMLDQRQAMSWFATEYPVLLAATGRSAVTGFDRHCWQLAWAMSTHFARQGHWHSWLATYRTALAAASRLADPAGQARIHRGLGRASVWLARYDDAHRHYRRALDLYGQSADIKGQAHTEYDLAEVCILQGQHADALQHLQRAQDGYRLVDDTVAQARTFNGLGWCNAQLGGYEQTIAYCEQSLALLLEAADAYTEAATLDTLGFAYTKLGRHEEAIKGLQRCLVLRQEAGDRYGEAETLVHLGDAHHGASDVAAAREEWQRALAILSELDHPGVEQIRARLQEAADVQAGPR